MRPSGKTNSCRDWSEAGFLQQRRRFAYLNQSGDPGAVCFDLSVKVADALGQSDRFRAGHRYSKSFFTDPPPGHLQYLTSAQRFARVETQIIDPEQRVNAFTVLVRSVVIE